MAELDPPLYIGPNVLRPRFERWKKTNDNGQQQTNDNEQPGRAKSAQQQQRSTEDKQPKPGEAGQQKATETDSLHWIGDAQLGMPARLIKNTLPETGVALLGGQYSAGKTFVGIDIALSIAFGVPFLERRTRQGGTLWIAAEGGGEVEIRVAAARAEKFAEHDAGEVPFCWTDSAPPLKNDAGWQWLAKKVAEADKVCRERFRVPLRLIIIDTLAAACGLEDENDNATAAKLMKKFADFGREHELLVTPIAHMGKMAETGIRGASAFAAGADAILGGLTQGSDKVWGKIEGRCLVVSKLRRGRTGFLSKFRLDPVELGQDEDGDPVESCSVDYYTLDCEAEAPAAEKPAKMTPTTKVFFESLDEALIRGGRSHRPRGDGPEVRAVGLDAVRREFEVRYPTGEADEEARKSTLRGRGSTPRMRLWRAPASVLRGSTALSWCGGPSTWRSRLTFEFV